MTTATDGQMTLDLGEVVVPDYAPAMTIQQRYEAWIALNPWVIPAAEHLISAYLAAGHRRCSLKRVWEVIRYEYGRTRGDEFQCNNDFTSRAARDVLARHPEWADAISIRELRAA